MSLKVVFVALAAAGSAYAQCRSTSTLNIENSGDASALASCTTYVGDISIDPRVAGVLTIPGVRKIDGDFIANNVTRIDGLGADSLTEITGDMILSDMTNLVQLNFPNLKTVGGTIRWNALSRIQTTTVGPINRAGSLEVTNTRLQNLDSFDLVSITEYKITNNQQLQKISAQLGNVTRSLVIEGNSQPTVSFPNLIWARNMTFINCSSIELPSLTALNGSLTLIGNNLESFSATNLTDVGSDITSGGSLVFSDNPELTNVSLPLLRRIGGGFQIARNGKLGALDTFPKVAEVTGALSFKGSFKKVALPALANVDGTFTIESSEDIGGDCAVFQKQKSAGNKIFGAFSCKSNSGKPGNTGGSGSGSGSGSGTDTKPSSAASVHVSLPVVLGLSGILALVAGLF